MTGIVEAALWVQMGIVVVAFVLLHRWKTRDLWDESHFHGGMAAVFAFNLFGNLVSPFVTDRGWTPSGVIAAAVAGLAMVFYAVRARQLRRAATAAQAATEGHRS